MQNKNYPLSFDVRLIERNLKSGILAQKEHEKYLKNLPDVSQKMEKLEEDEKAPEKSKES